MRRGKTPATIQREVDQWNAKYPIGTPVRYYPVRGFDEYEETVTTSEAWSLEGHTAVVGLNRRGGCFALDNIKPIKAPAEATSSQGGAR